MSGEQAAKVLQQHRQVRLYWHCALQDRGVDGVAVSEEALARGGRVERALYRLQPAQRKLLGLMYLDGSYTPQRLCQKLTVSPATFYRKRKEALEDFSNAYDDKT